MNNHVNKPAYFSIVDLEASCMAFDEAVRITSVLSSMGICTLIISDVTSRLNIKTTRELKKHIAYLKGDSLRGYLSLGNKRICALNVCGEEADVDMLEAMRETFDLVVFSLGPDLNQCVSSMIKRVPALLVLKRFEPDHVDYASDIVALSKKDEETLKYVAFACQDGDGIIEARISEKLSLPSWGDISKLEYIAERIVFSSVRSESNKNQILNNRIAPNPILPLMSDGDITEIMVNGPSQVYIERMGKMERTDVIFQNEEHLRSVIERMVGEANRRIDESSPMVDARLADGSRLNAVIPPLSVDGACLTIRKFLKKIRSLEDIISTGMVDRESMQMLVEFVRRRASIVVSGGTGSGKTTLLGVLVSSIVNGERIITVEDAAELSINLPHVVRLESRPKNLEGGGEISIRNLVKNALRMRPDRIVVGECRGAEAFDMLSAMNTGHEGSLTSVHANSARDALSRLETMVMMADVALPHKAVREQIARAVDIIVQVERHKEARKIVEISEVTGMEGETICLQTLAQFEKEKGKLVSTGFRARLMERER